MIDLLIAPKPLKLAQNKICYQVWMGEALLLPSSTDPEFEACRVLKELGYKGKIRTWRLGSPYPALLIPIEWGAERATVNRSRVGPVIEKYRPFDSSRMR